MQHLSPNPLATLHAAIQHHQAGRLTDAEQAYREILAVNPNHVDALHLLGALLHQSGKSQLAIDYIERAIALQPHAADPHYNLGLVHQALKHFAQAAACFREAIRLDPTANKAAHYQLGNALAEQGQFDDALENYRRAIAIQPSNTAALLNQANVLTKLGRIDEAIDCYQRVLQIKPDSVTAHDRLGVLLIRRKKFDEAEQALVTATKLNPNFADAHHHLAMLRIEQKRDSEALPFLEQAVRLNPNDAEAQNNLGNLCRALGQLELAVSHCREAIRLKPSFVEAHNNLGVALRDSGQIEAALQSYERAVQLSSESPESHWNRALTLLLAGNYAAGWTEYEWRWKRRSEQPRKFAQPAWDRSPLSGRTILLYAEQGLGDTLQFIRYAPLIKQRGGKVVVECQPELVRLLRHCADVDVVVNRGDALPAFDVQAPLLSLPRIFGTTLEDVPASVPYLTADPDGVTEFSKHLRKDDALKVGIVWRGNPSHQNDRFRSISLEQLLPLMQIPGVTLYSLQKGAGREQLEALSDKHAIVDLAAQLNDFDDTAAAIANMDLVIGCDTSVVHLAGALGVTTWLLLPAAPDWRWMLNRGDTPWYPTMRLFRQARLGVWEDVIATVRANLESEVERRHQT